jgi:hypothetical protein
MPQEAASSTKMARLKQGEIAVVTINRPAVDALKK